MTEPDSNVIVLATVPRVGERLPGSNATAPSFGKPERYDEAFDVADEWIVIPKWDRFQHYRDRTPPWIKVYLALLDDPAYLALSGNARSVLHGLWLMYAMSHRRVPHDARMISRRLALKVTKRTLASLNDAGFIEFSASKPLAPRYQGASNTRARGETEVEVEDPLPPSQSEGGSNEQEQKHDGLTCKLCGEPVELGKRCRHCGATPRLAGSNARGVNSKPKRSAYARAEAMTRNGGWHYALDDYRTELADYDLTEAERDMLEHLWSKLSTEPEQAEPEHGFTPATAQSDDEWRELF